jgi:tetratricopeptide (TPR) repeat protein
VFYTQESARFIPVLESKLAVNRRSPIFARLASYYLMEGKVDRTVELCLEGLHHFPHYPTAHLILGKAYEAQGRHVEAMLEYQKAKRAVPDNPTVVELLRKVEVREQDAFRAFAEERGQKLQERRNTVAFELYAGEDPDPGTGASDFVLERLRAAEQPPPAPPSPVPLRRERPAEHRAAEASTGPKIVTATLAEIYANQGEYQAAITAYERLREQHPEEAGRYSRRIAQLEEAARLQHAEQKS